MIVLDGSAVLAMLLDEPGGEAVAAVVRGAELSIINYAEILTKVAESGGDLATVEQIVIDNGIRIRAFREGHAIEVARLRPLTMHLGLSLGDRACLAQGRFSVMPVLTADRRMAKAGADLNLDIRLIR